MGGNMTRNDRVLIAGGGIGGLASAMGLVRSGVRSLVLEKAPALGEIGAGLEAGPDAFHSFNSTGLGDPARARGVCLDTMRSRVCRASRVMEELVTVTPRKS